MKQSLSARNLGRVEREVRRGLVHVLLVRRVQILRQDDVAVLAHRKQTGLVRDGRAVRQPPC